MQWTTVWLQVTFIGMVILAAGGISIINSAWSAFFYMVLDLAAKGSFRLTLTNVSSTTLAKASNAETLNNKH